MRGFGLLLILAGCGPPLPAYTPIVREPVGRTPLVDAGIVDLLRETEDVSVREAKRLVFAVIKTPNGLSRPRVQSVMDRVKAVVQRHAQVFAVEERENGGLLRYRKGEVEGRAEIRLEPADPGRARVTMRFHETPTAAPRTSAGSTPP